ncbi:MAG: nuclear transport factor 2 family protein [Cyanobacteria bacterium P01_H01_bin.153]
MDIESKHLKDRLDIIDVLYRFARSIDTADEAMMRSTLTDDCTLIFTEAAQAAGAAAPRIEGGEAFAKGVAALSAELDTTHQITNPLVTLTGDRATVNALVEAQHFPKGDRSRHILQKNRYDLTLAREHDGIWRIQRFVLDNAWTDGDVGVITDVVEQLAAQAA